MDNGRLPNDDLSFREAERLPAAVIEEELLIQRPALRRVRKAFRRALLPGLGILVVAALATVSFLLPQPAPPAAGQEIPGGDPEPRAAVTLPIVEEQAPRPEPQRKARRGVRKKHLRVVVARSRPRKARVALAAAPSAPPAPEAQTQDKERASGGKKATRPDPPEPTLLFRRLYNDQLGDHFHSVKAGEVSSKQQEGYVLKEEIGLLFEKQAKGTVRLAIAEGVMGWIYEKDQGADTVPLYRLVGPDYHNNEVIFTASETKKNYWIGDGWKVEGVPGYVARA